MALFRWLGLWPGREKITVAPAANEIVYPRTMENARAVGIRKGECFQGVWGELAGNVYSPIRGENTPAREMTANTAAQGGANEYGGMGKGNRGSSRGERFAPRTREYRAICGGFTGGIRAVFLATIHFFGGKNHGSIIFQRETPKICWDSTQKLTGRNRRKSGGGLRSVRVCSIIPFARCDTAFVVREVMIAIRLAANPVCVGVGGLDFGGRAGAGAG